MPEKPPTKLSSGKQNPEYHRWWREQRKVQCPGGCGKMVLSVCQQCDGLRRRKGVTSFVHPNGYVILQGMYDHPNRFASSRGGSMFEHTFVMSGHLGRALRPGEEVHHKNAIKHDNRIENLELWVKSQPAGARVSDLIEFALWVLAQYGEERESHV